MVASTVWDGRASVRFRAEPLGDIAQLVERCLSKAKAGGSTPLIPTVVGPDIKMAPHSTVRSRSREKTWHCGRVVKAIAC